MRILVTGGAGYIGSHACKRLLADGYDVVVLDNLVRGHAEAIERLRTLENVTASRLVFHEGDVADRALLERIFGAHKIDAVLHFAALAYVRESVDEPLAYYRANTASSVELIDAACHAGVPRFVFSSTCATYGEAPPDRIPITEDCPQVPINPYGWSKLFTERMLRDTQTAMRRAGTPVAGVAMLRYFNVAGCDPDGLLGEDHDPETHLIPIVLRVAQGKREKLTIFGTDHATPDGTCVRDYIHVTDLVDAHVRVMNALEPADCRAYNLGNGSGYSIREIVEAARRVTGHPIPTEDGPGHPGDPPTLSCDASLIERDVGWRPRITDVEEIIRTAWRWFEANQHGYGSGKGAEGQRGTGTQE